MKHFIIFISLFFSVQLFSSEKLLRQGRGLIISGNTEAGEKKLKQALESFEGYLKIRKTPEIYFSMGKAHFYMKQYKEALQYFSRAIAKDKHNVQYKFMSGVCYKKMHDRSKAIKTFKQILDKNVAHSDSHYELGHSYMLDGKIDDAYEHFAKCITINKIHVYANFYMAQILVDRKKLDEALKHLDVAIRFKPSLYSAQISKAQIYSSQGKLDEAIAVFKRITLRKPGILDPYESLIQIYQLKKDKVNRDLYRDKIIKQWKLKDKNSKGDHFVIDHFQVDNNRVIVQQRFDFSGDKAIKYMFDIYDAPTNKFWMRVTLGSYKEETEKAVKEGRIKLGEKIYHINSYQKNDQTLFGYFTKEPSYDDARDKVIAILQKDKSVFK